jgi:hypothetical protein
MIPSTNGHWPHHGDGFWGCLFLSPRMVRNRYTFVVAVLFSGEGFEQP